MTETNLPRLVTVKTAAPILELTEGALRKVIARRDLPPGVVVRFGGRALRLDLEALIAWARNCELQRARFPADIPRKTETFKSERGDLK